MDKLINWLNDKKLAIFALIFMAASLFPFFYLSHYVRPAGDDFGFARHTHAAWLDTGSLWEVIKAAFFHVKLFYNSIGGEWFAAFFYSLMPEVFAPYGFWAGPYLIMLCHIAGTFFFLNYFLRKILGMRWEYFALIWSLILIISLQYLPSNNTGVYWFAAGVHYILPHMLFLFALISLSKYIITSEKKYLYYLLLLTFAIGGSNYSHGMLIIIIFTLMIIILAKKNRKILYLILPFLICLIGLFIQLKSPGNVHRFANIGEEFGFDFSNVIKAIFLSLAEAIRNPFNYFSRAPLSIVIVLLLIVFCWIGLLTALKEKKTLISFRYPLLFIILVFLANSAMNLQRIYAVEINGIEDASSGTLVVGYLVFWLSWLSVILYCEGYLITKLLNKKKIILTDEGLYRKYILFPAFILCFALCVFFRSNVKDSFAYQSYVYVKSGAAAEYKWRIAEYMVILLDDDIEEAYLKPINNEQGPLLHWTIVDDESNFVNWAYQVFYRKKLVKISDEDWHWE
ncbi:MAG: hypothetical protein FWG91_05065 [Lachnospiraceae bacterium]|nr:hypothetical protein [Lachnospiraceae bacterium]